MDEFFTPVISEQPTLLPLFSTKVAAGFPSPADDHVEKRLDINEFMIDHAASTFFVTIKGDSMIDVGLLPGDKVVVDRSKTPGIGFFETNLIQILNVAGPRSSIALGIEQFVNKVLDEALD